MKTFATSTNLMSTTANNRNWAFAEAKRRAVELNKSYTIYVHRNNTDYIIRPMHASELSAPWRICAIVEDRSK